MSWQGAPDTIGTEAQSTDGADRQMLAKRSIKEGIRVAGPKKGRSALGDLTNRTLNRNVGPKKAARQQQGNSSKAASCKQQVPAEQKPKSRAHRASQVTQLHQAKQQDGQQVDATEMDVDLCSSSAEQQWKDVDKDDHNPLSCALFAEDIMSNLFRAEAGKRPDPNYMQTVQTDITPFMRSVLIDWLVEVAQEYRLVSETLCLTVDYVDRYLSVVPTPRNQLQLVGVTCMLLASKYEEIYAPTVEDFCFITENTYTKAEVLVTERRALQALKFELTVPSVRLFLRRFIKAAVLSAPRGKADARLDLLSSYLTELMLLAYDALQYRPSMIAAGAVLLAQFSLSKLRWNKTLEHYTRYSASQLRDCVLLIYRSYALAKTSELPATREKYSIEAYGFVASLEPPAELPDYLFM